MLLKAIVDSDLNKCIQKTNKFIKTLPLGMWYSTQINPLVQEVTTTELTEKTDKGTLITRTSRNRHDFMAITYYVGDHEITTPSPVVEKQRQDYTG